MRGKVRTKGVCIKCNPPFSVTRCVSMRGKVRTKGVCIKYSRPFSVHYNQVLPDAVVVEELPRVTPYGAGQDHGACQEDPVAHSTPWTRDGCMRSGLSITSTMKTKTRRLCHRDNLLVHAEPSHRGLAFEALPRYQGTTPPSCFGAGHVKRYS